MSVMSADGKIYGSNGSWWSPYGDTDEEIQRNLKTGNMPNAPDAMRAGPEYFTGTPTGDDNLQDFLGSIGALGGQAASSYNARKKSKKTKTEK
jgi:hypothetical protein